MNRRDRISGLLGLRLALYDEALRAGPRGLGRAELLATVADEALRMGMRPESQAAGVDWLLEAGWIAEYTTGRYRARAKEDVMAEVECGNQESGKPETRNPKPETVAAPRAALRAPSACPQQPRKGQLALFGGLR